MSQLVRKSTPLLVTFALMAWCCWSQVHESEPLLANIDEAQLPRIDRGALSPEISAPCQRDPFQQPKTERDQPVETAAVEPVLEVPPEPLSETSPEPLSEAPPEPLFDPRTMLSSFRLNATMVGTDYPVAMINGRVYREGERIVLEDLPELPCRLHRVGTDRVVLKIENEEFEIIYSYTSIRQQRTNETQKDLTTQGQPDQGYRLSLSPYQDPSQNDD